VVEKAEYNVQSGCSDGTGSSARSTEANSKKQISKTYQYRPKFGGGFDDDFQEALRTYETFAQMYGLTEHEKRSSLPLILEGAASAF
jgi:hypothetical protein